MILNGRAASRPELGGVERWARELAARLPSLEPGRYEVEMVPPWLSGPAGQAWEQVVLPAVARRRRARLLLNPANLAPLAYPGNVVVIHDAAALREPGWYSPAYARWQRAIMPLVARRARAIITPSAFSRDELVELLGARPEAISVIPGGADERFGPSVDPGPAAAALGLDRPYVLSVAGRTTRKNLTALAPLAVALRERDMELVLAGPGRREFAAGQEPPPGRVIGHVPDALLPGLYAGAAAFVLPSLHEGFGLTALEAMKTGLPVVAGDGGALPELCGDGATYVDPRDPAAICEAVLGACAQSRPVMAALERAERFSWERTAVEVDRLVGSLLAP